MSVYGTFSSLTLCPRVPNYYLKFKRLLSQETLTKTNLVLFRNVDKKAFKRIQWTRILMSNEKEFAYNSYDFGIDNSIFEWNTCEVWES